MSVKTLENIRHNGELYEAGKVIQDISKEEAKRLIDLKVAISDTTSPQIESLLNTGEQENLTYEDLLKEIDHKKLKELAEKVELTFAGNISNVNLIDLILDNDKEEEVLALSKEDE